MVDISSGLKTAGPPGYLTRDGVVVGFGDSDFQLRVISRALAADTIIRNHYSGRIVQNSYVHLGVFRCDQMVGVLQFGYALNPNSGRSTVTGTGNKEYLELNRMSISDDVPRNGESKAISYAIKAIRRLHPSVQWIQSFADERCGCLGVVYQASNFLYVGSHLTTFWWLDGQWYHDLLMTAHEKGGGRGRYLRDNAHRAERHQFRQYRYIFFTKPSARKRLVRKVQPYPKPRGT